MSPLKAIREALERGDTVAIALVCSILGRVKVVDLTDEEVKTLAALMHGKRD